MSSINMELIGNKSDNSLIDNLDHNKLRNTTHTNNFGFSDQRVSFIDQEMEIRKMHKEDQTRNKSMDI